MATLRASSQQSNPSGVTFREKQYKAGHQQQQRMCRGVLANISNTTTTRETDNFKNGKGRVILPVKDKPTQRETFKNETQEVAAKNVDKSKPAVTQSYSLKRGTAKTEEDYLTAGEYSDNIYQFLIDKQAQYKVDPDYLVNHTTVNSKIRTILIDWLLQVHYKFELEQETLFLTVSIIDRYMELDTKINKSMVQLFGVTALLIASKYEDVYPPTISDLVYITADTYTEEQIKESERNMLKDLDYRLGGPSPLIFLRRLSRLAKVTHQMHNMGKFFIEVMLCDSGFLSYTPLLQAAAAFFTIIKLHESTKHNWSKLMEDLCGYSKDQLKPCVTRLSRRTMKMLAQQDCKAVVDKYSSSKFMMITTHASLRGEVIRKLAAL